MKQFLHEVNGNLRALDEAYRRGRITREDYRTRRRQLLGGLYDSADGSPPRTATDAGTLLRGAQPAPAARHPGGDEAVSAMFPPWWQRLLARMGLLGRRH